MNSICLFGGSFDPVHLGHLLVARAALEELEVEKVLFVPAAISPFKTHLEGTEASLRIRMLRTALAGKPWAVVDDQEIRRGGISYTVDTLRSYTALSPRTAMFYLIGHDNAAHLAEWREPDELAKLAEFVVIPRPEKNPGAAAKAADSTSRPDPRFKLRYLNGFPLGVSSSEIRDRIRRGLSVEELLPFGVGEIIRNNRLYL